MSNAATKVPPTLAEAIAVIERQQYIIESLQRDLQLLRGHLNQRLREMFGRSSERFEDPNQLGLFGELVSESRAEKETPPKQEPDKKQRKRAPFGEGLRRELTGATFTVAGVTVTPTVSGDTFATVPLPAQAVGADPLKAQGAPVMILPHDGCPQKTIRTYTLRK